MNAMNATEVNPLAAAAWLPQDVFRDLAEMANATGWPVSDIARAAMAAHVARWKAAEARRKASK